MSLPLLGLLRSLLIYHAIPFRQAGLRALLGQFVTTGALAFDLGAHVGNRTHALRAIGARVVAVEPQPKFARFLRWLFNGDANVVVLEAAVFDRAGDATLFVSDVHSTVSTLSADWRAHVGTQPGFSGVAWNREVPVEVTTLDAMIARYGEPQFVKIDVEGSEAPILRGLTRPLQALSFEYVPGALAEAATCVDLLERLGSYRYNWSSGETMRLGADEWRDAAGIRRFLASDAAARRSGDIYCRLTTAPAGPGARP